MPKGMEFGSLTLTRRAQRGIVLFPDDTDNGFHIMVLEVALDSVKISIAVPETARVQITRDWSRLGCGEFTEPLPSHGGKRLASLYLGDRLSLDGGISVSPVEIVSNRTKLTVRAPLRVEVLRDELTRGA